jgi:linoleate 8R-lipoxygenase/9,12-octadecadienoate 8-hydroperoxide 8R-isomerase
MGFATLYKRLSTPDMFDRRKKNTNGSGNPIVQVEQVVEASMRPLPTETGDGTYITEEKTTGIIKDIPHLPIKDLEGLAVNVKSKLTGDDINDRDYIMEQVIQLAADLPSTSRVGKELTNAFLKTLWTDLQHPPTT